MASLFVFLTYLIQHVIVLDMLYITRKYRTSHCQN